MLLQLLRGVSESHVCDGEVRFGIRPLRLPPHPHQQLPATAGLRVRHPLYLRGAAAQSGNVSSLMMIVIKHCYMFSLLAIISRYNIG